MTDVPKHFCCYFDHRYLPRGLATIRSLRRFEPAATFWVLCLTDRCRDALEVLAEPQVKLISLDEFEAWDPDLLQAKQNRSLIEYYFTCTPSLVLYVLCQADAGEIVTYIDGDLYFYSSPAVLFDSMDGNSISLIEHRFPREKSHLSRFGIYNVGWLSFRNDAAGKSAAIWWRERCIEWCYDLLEVDRYGDQKYLDRFPELFERTVVLSQAGANLAPWNLATHALSLDGDRVLVDDEPLIFFHFHGMTSFGENWYFASHHEFDAPLTPLIRRNIYAPYLRVLTAVRKEVAHLLGAEHAPPLWRGRTGAGLGGRLRMMFRRPKQLATLLLKGQAIRVPDGAARPALPAGGNE